MAAYTVFKHLIKPSSRCFLCKQAFRNERHLQPIELCPACLNDLPQIKQACLRCGLPLPANSTSQPTDDKTPACGSCSHLTLQVSQCYCLFEFTHPVDFLIRAFKHNGNGQAERLTKQLMLQQSQTLPWHQWDGLVPTPLHWRKLIKRGFNQSQVLANTLAKQHGISLIRVKRHRHTPPQQGLNRKQRLSNLAGAFTAPPVAGKRLLIIDDVVTTGATTEAVAQALIAAGASQVDALSFARTPKPKA